MRTGAISLAITVTVVFNRVPPTHSILASSQIMSARELQGCSSTASGCDGPGLWDESICSCRCVENYCYDSFSGTCSTYGACPNDFADCTPKVNCPYFANQSTGKCDSGPDMLPGVFQLFWTELECCTTSFSWDPGSCITETNPPTIRPTSAATLSPTTALDIFQTTGFALPEFSIRLHNMPDVEINNVQQLKLTDVIRSIAEDEVRILNVIITSVDITDTIYSSKRALRSSIAEIDHKNLFSSGQNSHRNLASILSLSIEIRVSETALLPDELYSTIRGALQKRKYEIDREFRNTFGSDYENVIFEIEGMSTTLAPSLAPDNDPKIVISSNSNVQSSSEKKQNPIVAYEQGDDSTINTVTIALVSLFSILFVFIACGLVLWQRKRDLRFDKYYITRSYQYKREESKRGHRRGHRREHKHQSKHKPKQNYHHVSRISNHPYVDEEQNKMNAQLMTCHTPQDKQVSPQNDNSNNILLLEQGFDREGSPLEPQENFPRLHSTNVISGQTNGNDGRSILDEVKGTMRMTDSWQSNNINASSGHSYTSVRSKNSSSSKSVSSRTKSSRKSRKSPYASLPKVEEEDALEREMDNHDYHREDYFDDEQVDEASFDYFVSNDSLPRQDKQLRNQSSCSISEFSDEDFFSRKKSDASSTTADFVSLGDDLFS